MSIGLRSALFNLAFWTWTVAITLAGLAVIWGPRRWTLRIGRAWGAGTMMLLKVLCDLRYEVRGVPPRTPAIVASKHQSAWDTLIFPILLREPAYVLKRELLWIPLLGLCFRRAGHIPVDRAGGTVALRRMIRAAREAIAQGRPLVIYPEGTRTAPGERRPYAPGVAALYTQLGSPVVPVALNSGLFWGRRTFLKRPGRIVIEFLEPIPPGLSRRAFLAELEQRIESASDRLAAEPTRPGGAGPRS